MYYLYMAYIVCISIYAKFGIFTGPWFLTMLIWIMICSMVRRNVTWWEEYFGVFLFWSMRAPRNDHIWPYMVHIWTIYGHNKYEAKEGAAAFGLHPSFSGYAALPICSLYCGLYIAYVQLVYGPYMTYVWPICGSHKPYFCICREVGVTGMIEPNIGQRIVKILIIKWDAEGRLGRLVYETR